MIASGIKGGDILEVGPGPGYVGLELAKQLNPTSLTGCEISPAMIRFAEKNAAEYGISARYVQGNCMKMPFADESFDTVISNGSLHVGKIAVHINEEHIDRRIAEHLINIDIVFEIFSLADCFQRLNQARFIFLVHIGDRVIEDIGIAGNFIIAIHKVDAQRAAVHAVSAIAGILHAAAIFALPGFTLGIFTVRNLRSFADIIALRITVLLTSGPLHTAARLRHIR